VGKRTDDGEDEARGAAKRAATQRPTPPRPRRRRSDKSPALGDDDKGVFSPRRDALEDVVDTTERGAQSPADPFEVDQTVRTHNPFLGASGREAEDDLETMRSFEFHSLPSAANDVNYFDPSAPPTEDVHATFDEALEADKAPALVDPSDAGRDSTSAVVERAAREVAAAARMASADGVSPVPELSLVDGGPQDLSEGPAFTGLVKPWEEDDAGGPHHAGEVGGRSPSHITQPAIDDGGERTVELTDPVRTAKKAGRRLPPGEAVDFYMGGYHVHRRLGQGGMAVVFLARPDGGRDDVVLKRIRPSLVKEERYVKLFMREASIAAMLDHPNCVRIIDHAEEEGEYFIVMEFLDGIDLRDLADRNWSEGHVLPLEPVLRTLIDCARGLDHAHHLSDHKGRPARLVHRDVSPENLFVTSTGATKVLDFGIAKGNQHVEKLTRTGEVKGKVPYLAPEQILGKKLDGRCDMFALCVTAYWLLTGRRPFDGTSHFMTIKKIIEVDPEPITLLNPFIPDEVEGVILKGLAKEPEDRFARCADFARALEVLLEELPEGCDDVMPILEQGRSIPRPTAEPFMTGPATRPSVPWD
jgi:serine/threonine protein kinase